MNKCRWKKVVRYMSDDYETGCGHGYSLKGSLDEEGYNYCPNCGKEIEEVSSVKDVEIRHLGGF